MAIRLPSLPKFGFLPESWLVPPRPPDAFSLIDIGTDTVKAAVVHVENDQIRVLGHSLAPTEGQLIPRRRSEAAVLAAAVNRALQEAEDATESSEGFKLVPDYAILALPSTHLAGKRFTFQHQRSNPADPVSEREVDQLWDRAMRQVRKALTQLPGAQEGWLPQTVTPAGVWIDDHRVNDPRGLYGRILSLSVYGVACPPTVVDSLDRLAEKLDLEIYHLVPAGQSLATLVPTKDALLLDVGATHTSCYLIRHDSLIEMISIPVGGATFTHHLANSFRCALDAAESLKLAYSAQVLSAHDTGLVQRRLKHPLQSWADQLAEVLLQINGNERLPASIYLVGGSAVLPDLPRYLLASLASAELMFEQAPETLHLGGTNLSGFAGAPTGFRGQLLALALSLAKTI